MFYWKRFDLPKADIVKVQELYKKILPDNNFFFQKVELDLTHFLN